MKTYEIARVGADMLLDPRRYIRQCEQDLSARLEEAAAQCLRASRQGSVLLLSGPSGAGKTTTAHKLAGALTQKGRPGRVLSRDDYFLGHSAGPLPVDEFGEIDLESPARLDIPLLQGHLARLRTGETIDVPSFDFSRQERFAQTHAFSLEPEGVAVVEGIHALNPEVTGGQDPGIFASAGTAFPGARWGSTLPRAAASAAAPEPRPRFPWPAGRGYAGHVCKRQPRRAEIYLPLSRSRRCVC